MKKKTVISIIAALLALLTAAGCGGETAPTVTDPTTDPVTEALPETESDVTDAETDETTEETTAETVSEPIDLAAAPFRIVTAAGESSTTLSNVMTAFTSRLSTVGGLKYTVVSDKSGSGGDGTPEIVIGNANRPECAAVFAALGPLDWCVSVASNRIILLGGTPDATAKAVNWFLMNYVVKNITLVPGGELERFVSDEKLPDIGEAVPYTGSALRRLTVFAIGDSYFAGEGLDPKKDVWPALLASKQGQSFTNYGIGGSTVSDAITTNNPICRRISSMKSGSPDIVLFEGGANDWNHSIPLGTAGSRDSKTFRGAVALCVEQLHEKYPGAFIVCLSNWDYGKKNSAGIESTEYAKAFCEVASAYPYAAAINASDTSVIPAHMTSSVFRAKYCISSSDFSHLNKEGMKLVLPFFEKLIGDGYEAFAAGR
ncbi:MAG: SGNH/GDSL hydrolase family protein [Clostridia bacterium]|nr:SGNH/GDSL hydrolase family protein [Clostridia bacterium]